jgi:hypothetical protein
MSESAKKEFKELRKIIQRKGYKCVPGSGGGHVKILDPKGRRVIDENGPVILSTTPSDYRARDLAVARLIRAGVLTDKDLPWKPQKPKLLLGEPDEEKLSRDEQLARAKQAERDVIKGEQRTRQERTQEIRARLEPLLTTLGGWTKRGMIGEMADVAYHHNKGTAWGFPSVQAARANATSLRRGGTLSEDKATCWLGLLDTLEEAAGRNKLREAWFDLVRAARGLPPRTQPVVAYTAPTAVDASGPAKVLLQPEGGELVAEMEEQYGNGDRWSKRYSNESNPLLELHREGGVRWIYEFTDHEYSELSRALGFFEGLAVQLSMFDGQELVEPALARLRTLIEKVGEARFRELAKTKETE